MKGYATTSYWLAFLVWIAWMNWFLTVFNLALVGWPWDSGAMLRAALWPRLGFEQATQIAIMFGIGVAAILFMASIFCIEPILIGLSLYGFLMCWMELLRLRGGIEESAFGYDFSQGYTSLERDEPTSTARRKGNFISRWLDRRTARRLQREHEQQEADERRMDDLLDKIQRHGKESLTAEETQFMKRVSQKYRNRN